MSELLDAAKQVLEPTPEGPTEEALNDLEVAVHRAEGGNIDQRVQLAYLKSWAETLSWTLDLLDLYDERLAEIDGEERVYTDDHVAAKEKARGHLEEMRRGIENLEEQGVETIASALGLEDD